MPRAKGAQDGGMKQLTKQVANVDTVRETLRKKKLHNKDMNEAIARRLRGPK